MGRIRTVKPEFFTSPDTESVSMEARLLFIAMWCWADDYGIGEANMLGLRAFAFPEEDPYLDKEIPSLCKEIADGYGVKFYTVDRRAFYQILTWDDHQKTQRRAKDKNPHWDDPKAVPDQRFHGNSGTSEDTQGNSSRPLGKGIDGKGKGTGEQGNREVTTLSEPSVPTKKKTYPDEFQDWWQTYPRRRNASKKDAYSEWKKATKIFDGSRLLQLTAEYAANPGVSDDRYIPHPHKWLKDHRWESVDETNNHIDSEPEHRAVTAGDLLQSIYEPQELEAEVIPWQIEA